MEVDDLGDGNDFQRFTPTNRDRLKFGPLRYVVAAAERQSFRQAAKSGRYRYYACSIKARQGETGCIGQSIPMEKLDTLVAGYIEDRLLAPERLEEVLASVIDRRQDHAERRREHIAEMNKRSAEAELRLKRLYDAIEAGVADLDDPALKDRIVGLKATRDQAQADALRAQAILRARPSKPSATDASPVRQHRPEADAG